MAETIWDNNLWKISKQEGDVTFNGGAIITNEIAKKQFIKVKDVIELVFRLALLEMERTKEKETLWGCIKLNGEEIIKFGSSINLKGTSEYFNIPINEVKVYTEWNCCTIELWEKEQ